MLLCFLLQSGRHLYREDGSRLKITRLALRKKKLRCSKIADTRMMCSVFLLNEHILKFRILVEMFARIQMLETIGRRGGIREGRRTAGALFSLLFITCEMLSTFGNHHSGSQIVWPNSL